MKKIFLLILLCFFLSGCTNIKKFETTEIIDNSIKKNLNIANQYRVGYKYFLPRGLTIVNAQDFNEVARSGAYNYYIYIDVISYYNNVYEEYKINHDAMVSEKINFGEKYGYLEINEGKDKYLIEIMYNYAKIEVIVKKADINLAVANAISILSTVDYNRNILENLLGENILKFNEIQFDIFETKKDVESLYLTAIDEYGQYEDETIKDTDLIN